MRIFLILAALVTAAFITLTELRGPAQAQGERLTEADRALLHEEIRAYLLENPQILREMIALLEAEDAARAEVNDRELVVQHAEAIFEDGFSFVGGNPEGSFTIVEFLDYQCGFCKRAHPELMDLLAEDGDIRWIVKEMPILGPNSVLASRAAVATMIAEGAETYGRLVDGLMRSEGPIDDFALDEALTAAGADPATVRAAMQDPEVERRIAATRALADTLRITGTPTFVLGDLMVRGYVPRAQMQNAIAQLRAEE